MKPLVPIKKPADLSELGPRMAALKSAKRQEFVWHYCRNGGDERAAYQAAGYQSSGEAARIAIFKMMHAPDVVAAMTELGHHMLSALTLPAIGAVAKAIADPNHKDQMRAAFRVLDSTGFGVTTEHKVVVEHKSDDDMARRAAALAKEMGIDPVMLLGHERAKAIDAVFTEVVQPPSTTEDSIEDLF